MKVTAFILSLLAAIFSTLQSCAGAAVGALGSGLATMAKDQNLKDQAGSIAGAAVLIFIAAILAFCGGAFALKGRTAGWVLLTISAAVCCVAAATSAFKDGYVWGTVYAISALFAVLGTRKTLRPSGD